MANYQVGDILLIARNDGDVFDAIAEGAYRLAKVTKVWGDTINEVAVFDSVSTHNLGAFEHRLIVPAKILVAAYKLQIERYEFQDKYFKQESATLNLAQFINGDEDYDCINYDLSYQDQAAVFDLLAEAYRMRIQRVSNQLLIINKKIKELEERD